MDVTECFCKIGKVNYPEDGITVSYAANNYNVAYKEIIKLNRNYYRALDSIKPHINQRTFKSNFRIYLFDSRYQ